jgi:hypothetical protein
VAETVSAVVSEILAQGSFDLTSAEALAILNRRHKQMVTRARAYRTLSSATAVLPGGPLYTAPTGLLDMLQMLVTANATGTVTEYTTGRRGDIPSMLAGTILTEGDGGKFVEYGSSGTLTWLLYPNPGTASTVGIYGIYEPPTLLIDDTVPFRVDPDMIEGLMAGVFATALARPGEARPDLAAGQEAIFSAACEELRTRVNGRNRGGGPAQIRLQGVNA